MKKIDQNYFITNTDELLKDVLKNALSISNGMDMLVGYFFLSGLQRLNEGGALRGKRVRILVGMRAKLWPDGQEEPVFGEVRSLKAMRECFFDEMKRTMNRADDFGVEQMAAARGMLMEMVQRGELEIRQCVQPCHAKMYLFHYGDATRAGGLAGGMVMGSSNLSTAGLGDRLEINRRFDSKEPYIAGKKIFDELWEESPVLLDAATYDAFERSVLEQTWLGKVYSPYEMYLRVLHEYFFRERAGRVLTPSDVNPSYADLRYQTDAIAMALRSLRLYRGVIIADVVGLGKSIIAACVARNMNMPVTVICPPHLVQQWQEYGRDFSLMQLRVVSAGALRRHFDEYSAYADTSGERLIIVDEAHRFRNSTTQSYAWLHKICMGNRVVLLSATPFNNEPNDVYSLLSLFQMPSNPTLPSVRRLDSAFKKLQNDFEELRNEGGNTVEQAERRKEKTEEIARRMREIISPVVIRRSRIDLQMIAEYREDLAKQGYKPLTPEAPISHDYDLGDLKELYLWTLGRIYRGEGASWEREPWFVAVRYMPLKFVREGSREALTHDLLARGIPIKRLQQQQVNMAHFLRRRLVRRFESSTVAFRKSLDALIAKYEEAIAAFEEEGKVYLRQTIDAEERDEISVDDRDGIWGDGVYMEGGKLTFWVKAEYFTGTFLKLLKSDFKVLREVKAQWDEKLSDERQDRKLQEFARVLEGMLQESPSRRVVVFSEFADTVDALERGLKEKFSVLRYTSIIATRELRDRVLEHFDASRQGVEGGVRVLLTTDALSEGVNLNRADTVFNYDIPYNPMRVVQRVGRINRINQRIHEKLYIHNFFPSYIGESEVRLRHITGLKVAFVHAIMGDDTRILSPNEELKSFREDLSRQIEDELQHDDVESWDTPYRMELEGAQGTAVFARALAIPDNARTARHVAGGTPQGVLLYEKAGGESNFSLALRRGEVVKLSAEEALALFKAEVEELALPQLSKDFPALYAAARSKIATQERVMPKLSPREVQARDRVQKAVEGIRMGKGGQTDAEYLQELRDALQARALSSKDIEAVLRVDFRETGAVMELQKQLPEVILKRVTAMLLAKRSEAEQQLLLSEELRGE